MKFKKWLLLTPILLVSGLLWRSPATANPVRSAGSPLSENEMESVYGGLFTYCGGPTCPNAGSCVHFASGTWVFYYNNGFLDCYGGFGGCSHVTVGGVTATVPCSIHYCANSTCTAGCGSKMWSSNQPYCNS